MNYKFTTDWFSSNEPTWKSLINEIKPKRYLEIGSYEGRSAVFMIKTATHHQDLYLHCIDTWEGGVEHDKDSMGAVESNFNHNMALATVETESKIHLTKMKEYSNTALLKLHNQNIEKFDFIYIDGSHQAPDVLRDAVLAFDLLRVGGIMIFDDYTWAMEPLGSQDLVNSPKLAIDSFLNCYIRKFFIIRGPLYQLYLQKIKE